MKPTQTTTPAKAYSDWWTTKGAARRFYRLLYSEIAAKEPNPLVKAAALRACNRTRSTVTRTCKILPASPGE